MVDIVVGFGGGKRRKKVPWRFVALAIVVLMAATGIGILASQLWDKDRGALVADRSTDIPESVDMSRSLLGAGKIDEAEKAVEDALRNKQLPAEERRLLYVERGRVAIAQEDYEAAISAYTKAWEIEETYDVARKLGSTWQQVGDNAKAVTFYKRAMELNPKNSPSYESEQNILQQMVEMLENES